MNAATKKALIDAITAEVVAKVSLLLEEDGPSAKAADATCGATTQTGTACKTKAGACRHHKAAPKAKAPKAKATKVVQVEVTGGNRVTRASIAKLRELGVTATGKRSLEVVQRRAKVAGLTIEAVPFGTLS